MIPNILIHTALQPCPVDMTTIRTDFHILDVVGDYPSDQLDTLPSHIRPLILSMPGSAKVDGWNRPTEEKLQPKRYNPDIPTRLIHIDGFGVVKLHADKDPVSGWHVRRIDFSPGGLINSHNGRITDDEPFKHSLSVLIYLVSPLLADPDDEIHIVPSLDPRSLAYLDQIEIPYHLLDEDGSVLHGFRHAKHREIHQAA